MFTRAESLVTIARSDKANGKVTFIMCISVCKYFVIVYFSFLSGSIISNAKYKLYKD